MTNSIFAEQVLQKISGIDEELESVYQTVEAIKNLKSIIERQQKNDKEFFDNFSENVRILNQNKNQSSLFISELQNLKNKVKKKFDDVFEAYEQRQNKIDAALTLLNIQKESNEFLEQKLIQEFDGLDNNIEKKLAGFRSLLELEIKNFLPKAELKINEVINKLSSESDKLLSNFSSDKKLLIQDITQFKNKVEGNLSYSIGKSKQDLSYFKKEKSDEIYNKIEDTKRYLSKIIESRLDKIAEEQSSFLERQNVLTQRQNITIENLTLQLKSLERAYEQEKLQNADTLKQIIEEINKTTQELNGYVYREAVTNVDKKFENLKKEIEETYKKKGLFG